MTYCDTHPVVKCFYLPKQFYGYAADRPMWL